MEKLNNQQKQELINKEAKRIYANDSLSFEDQEELACLIASFIKDELNDYLPGEGK
jgi:hypothetical protein